jgi:hypothetical protein
VADVLDAAVQALVHDRVRGRAGWAGRRIGLLRARTNPGVLGGQQRLCRERGHDRHQIGSRVVGPGVIAGAGGAC